ncbi:MAG: hypothetical protein QOF27_1501 [Gaiellaceae bacterium]|jgi:hypothetical protein|nr:hypothetical protein [Gaiellaceae bacterium]
MLTIQGVPLDRVARWMGHAPSTLEQWYRHELEERDALQELARWQPESADAVIMRARRRPFRIA